MVPAPPTHTGVIMFGSTVSALALGLAVAATGVGAGRTNANEATDMPKMAEPRHDVHKTGAFQGAKANTGYAVHYRENGKSFLKVSDDFVIPDTPAPSWQIVDSSGNVYLLKQFKIKGGVNRVIEVPNYVRDI